jgi:hypothetical protein
MTTYAHFRRDRWVTALVIAASLLLVLFMLGVAALAVAIQQRVVQPPHFALHVGHLYLTAPCPAPTLVCDPEENYYAIWSGYDLPDGRIHFDEVFFRYLPTKH